MTDFIGARHADAAFMARLKANVAKHKPVLDALARAGDCNACMVEPYGCADHRDSDAPVEIVRMDVPGLGGVPDAFS